MSRTAYYLKALLYIGVVAGGLYGLAGIFIHGFVQGIVTGAVFGAIGAVLLGCILVPIDLISTRNIPRELLGVQQYREIQVRGALDDVFKKSAALIKDVGIHKYMETGRDSFSISIRTKASIASIGENISLNFERLTAETVKIRILSSPAIKWTKFDYGANFRNVEKIKSVLSRNMVLA